ncbi:transcription factor [Ancistrocladus abbreviatus]
MEDSGIDHPLLGSGSTDAKETFSVSSRTEDDQEALIWAALERLPTFSRLRKGILTGTRGEANEIYIKDLGIEEQRKLVDKLVHVPEEDNEKFLHRLKNRLDM